MRNALYERFGFGESDPHRRPVIGSMHVAGGFVVPALFGVEIRFSDSQSPWPVPANLSREEILALDVPEIEKTLPMDRFIADMNELSAEFGFVVGDLNTEGVLDNALVLRGQQLFTDLFDDPALVNHLFAVVAETQLRVASCVKARTGTCSVATNRMVLHADPRLYVHANCSVQMVSPAIYRRFVLPWELHLAGRLQPYGVHHCGNNLHIFAGLYEKIRPVFVDVGWGSNIGHCRQALPDVFFSLRLSPARMLRQPAAAIRADIRQLLQAGYKPGRVGVCCINMDHGTPDENIREMVDAVRESSASRS